jgi:hypothetical protein
MEGPVLAIEPYDKAAQSHWTAIKEMLHDWRNPFKTYPSEGHPGKPCVSKVQLECELDFALRGCGASDLTKVGIGYRRVRNTEWRLNSAKRSPSH